MLRILYTKYYFYTDFLICFYDFSINCFYWVIFIALYKFQFYISEDLYVTGNLLDNSSAVRIKFFKCV